MNIIDTLIAGPSDDTHVCLEKNYKSSSDLPRLEGFMAQGGDPTGIGTGGPGYKFQYEGSDLKFDKAGVVAMANNGPATPTNGSQFFITFAPADFLDNGYTIFGQVTREWMSSTASRSATRIKTPRPRAM